MFEHAGILEGSRGHVSLQRSVLFYLDFTKFVVVARTSRSKEVPESGPPVFRGAGRGFEHFARLSISKSL